VSELARVQMELEHVNEQCEVAHRMAMHWRQRALAAEEQVRRLEQRIRRKQAL
jgi:hypothetical protein